MDKLHSNNNRLKLTGRAASICQSWEGGGSAVAHQVASYSSTGSCNCSPAIVSPVRGLPGELRKLPGMADALPKLDASTKYLRSVCPLRTDPRCRHACKRLGSRSDYEMQLWIRTVSTGHLQHAVRAESKAARPTWVCEDECQALSGLLCK